MSKKFNSIFTVLVFAVFAVFLGVVAADAQPDKLVHEEVKGKFEAGKFCAVCVNGMEKLISAKSKSTCPATAADIAVKCESTFAAETEGAATLICAGIGVAVEIVCIEAGGAEKFKEHADKYAQKVCKKVKACK